MAEVIPFLSAQDRKANQAVTAFVEAFSREIPKINPRMTKHEFADILIAVADMAREWAAELHQGHNRPMGEN